MVNNPNPRRVIKGNLKTRVSGSRIKIDNGPVYHLGVVQSLVSEYSVVVLGDSKAASDMKMRFMPRMETAELQELFMYLRPYDHDDPHYVESEQDPIKSGMTVDADAYRIRWMRLKKIECKRTGLPIFVKFGFRDSNPRCIIVSTHPSDF